jgi:hypothetical protein
VAAALIVAHQHGSDLEIAFAPAGAAAAGEAGGRIPIGSRLGRRRSRPATRVRSQWCSPKCH